MRSPLRKRSLQESDSDRRKYSFSSHSSLSRPRSIIADLHTAITTKQRLAVLRKLAKLLATRNDADNSENFSLHDISHISIDGQSSQLLSPGSISAIDLLHDGILNALALQLNTIIHRHGSNTAEVALVCRCLALVFQRCSREADFIVILQQQGIGFLHLLTETLSHGRMTQAGTESITVMLNILTAGSTGCEMVVSCKPIVLSLITMLFHFNEELSTGSINEILNIFKNLTYHVEEMRNLLLQHDTFLVGISRTSIRPDLSVKSKQRISSILRNIASMVECRTELAQQPLVIAILVRLTSRVVAEDVLNPDWGKLQRNLLDTMISLSIDQESSIVLILHGDGVFLNILQRLLKDENSSIRKKAACTLRLLSHKHSAPLLIHNTELIAALSSAALSDPSPAVKREAAEAFARLGSIANATEHQSYYESILDALTVLAQSAIRNNHGVSLTAEVLAMALREHSERSDNRSRIGIRPLLLLATADLALLNDAFLTADYSITTLFNLSKEESNHQLLLDQPRVMEAILHHASSYTMERGNRAGILTLLHLARPVANRVSLARHPVLLSSLIDCIRRIPPNDTLREPLVNASVAIAQAL